MKKESNYLLCISLLSGSLLASGLYLAAFHLYLPIADLLFFLTILLACLGVVKILNHYAEQLPIPLNRIVYWIHSMAFEVFSVSITFLMRPFGFMGWGKRATGPKTGRPILMIHGYLQNSGNWIFLKQALRRRGFGPIYTLNLTHPFRSIRDYGEIVAQKAKEIADETKRQDLTLIGHSMGGLVSAWYAAKVAKPGQVEEVITIGSPMSGTKLAMIAIGSNGKEMRCGSEFVCQLQNECQKHKEIRFYHIASRSDQIILPYVSALTGLHPEREYVVDDIGHMTLLFSPRVADKIEEWLTSRC